MAIGKRALFSAAVVRSLAIFVSISKNQSVGFSIERMLTDIEFWLGHGANRILFYDGNFFLGRRRLLEFCEALIRLELPSRMRWIATAVGRRVAKMDDELLARLKRAGIMQVAIGAESGLGRTSFTHHNKTTVETTLEAVRRLTKHGINQHLFFMIGYPDEPADALENTLDFVVKLKKINPNVTLFLNYVTPLPGSEVFRIAVERGHIEEPRSFEDWARFDYMQPNLLDISDNYRRRVSRFQGFLNVAYPLPNRRRLPGALRRFVQWRLDRRYLDFPLELSVLQALRSVRTMVAR